MKQYSQQLDAVAYRIARVSALIFISFGAFMLLVDTSGVQNTSQSALVNSADTTESPTSNTSTSTEPIKTTQDTAPDTQQEEPVAENYQEPVIETTGTTEDKTDGEVVTSEPEPVIAPLITFHTEVPPTITENFELSVTFTALTKPTVSIHGLTVSQIQQLAVVSQNNDTAIYLVPASNLPPGKYEIRARGIQSNGTRFSKTGPRFEVAGKEVPVSETDPVHIDETEPDTTKELELAPTATLLLPLQDRYTSFVPLQVRTNIPAESVSLYAKAALQSTEQYVGDARLYSNGQWLFMLDTVSLRDGEYSLFAKVSYNGIIVETETKRVLVANETQLLNSSPLPSSEPASLPPPPTPPPPSQEPTEDSIFVPRTMSVDTVEIPATTPVHQRIALSHEFAQVVPRVMKDNEEAINRELREYLSLVDPGTESRNATETVDRIMRTIWADNQLRNATPDVEARVRTEVSSIVTRAERFERLLKEREEGGRTGAEWVEELSKTIMIPEDSLVDIRSPREFGLVREDILKIDSVSPIVQSNLEATSTKILAEIRGTGLPNSLVTLFIYSTPVMVTLETDSDGSFVYVYERELEDGEHEVYVALTNTAGAVVAKSSGFAFVKTAEAFTLSDSEEIEQVVPVAPEKPPLQNPYLMVLSLSVLALGLVLLLLGTHMRSEPVIVAEE